MRYLTDHPILFSVASFAAFWLATRVGVALAGRRPLEEAARADFGIVETATLTLLGLIIGFTFSMASTRYDQRKTYEEAEANAIGTAWVRADLMPEAQAAKLRPLLKNYLDRRILFYTLGDGEGLRENDAQTARLQAEIWAVARDAARAQPTPPTTLAVASVNDVLNSQGYTQAAWWNRIPQQAWALMLALAACSCALVGYGAHDARSSRFLRPVLPLVVAVAFFLIADIESPRSGAISVTPQNLEALARSLQAP